MTADVKESSSQISLLLRNATEVKISQNNKHTGVPMHVNASPLMPLELVFRQPIPIGSTHFYSPPPATGFRLS